MLLQPKAPTDPLAEAEAALNKLRANPNDKHAAELLEQAFKALKDQVPRKADDTLKKY